MVLRKEAIRREYLTEEMVTVFIYGSEINPNRLLILKAKLLALFLSSPSSLSLSPSSSPEATTDDIEIVYKIVMITEFRLYFIVRMT
jgi:hypothetical protein